MNRPHPSAALLAHLERWYIWATGTQNPEDDNSIMDAYQPKNGGFVRRHGLCLNADSYYPNPLSDELDRIFMIEAGTDPDGEDPESEHEFYPFGDQNYAERQDKNTNHEDPARLAWVEGKLAEAGVVAAPKWYRDFEISFEYGHYRAVHVDYEGEWDGESWVGRGMYTSSRTLVGLREEIDALLEEAK